MCTLPRVERWCEKHQRAPHRVAGRPQEFAESHFGNLRFTAAREKHPPGNSTTPQFRMARVAKFLGDILPRSGRRATPLARSKKELTWTCAREPLDAGKMILQKDMLKRNYRLIFSLRCRILAALIRVRVAEPLRGRPDEIDPP